MAPDWRSALPFCLSSLASLLILFSREIYIFQKRSSPDSDLPPQGATSYTSPGPDPPRIEIPYGIHSKGLLFPWAPDRSTLLPTTHPFLSRRNTMGRVPHYIIRIDQTTLYPGDYLGSFRLYDLHSTDPWVSFISVRHPAITWVFLS